ncbi:MAG: hypothetical protein HKN60_01140, partial [Rhizobiales bacterium]|nr:hypothetical protein [Hyphomicrobiales bacterium]
MESTRHDRKANLTPARGAGARSRARAEGLYHPDHEHDSCGIGFVCNIDNSKAHSIVEQGLSILRNLEHRGAVGADPKAGDGCGILIQMPHDFLVAKAGECGFELPDLGHYGVGNLFLPRDQGRREKVMRLVEQVIVE